MGGWVWGEVFVVADWELGVGVLGWLVLLRVLSVLLLVLCCWRKKRGVGCRVAGSVCFYVRDSSHVKENVRPRKLARDARFGSCFQ